MLLIEKSIDQKYQDLLRRILSKGFEKSDRTGLGRIGIVGAEIRHDMSTGFPALTIRKVPYKSVKVELEGFIKGINSKKWYQERGSRFWDQWANPKKVPYANDDETKQKMLEEDDLGIIYGNNWRDFHDPMAAEAIDHPSHSGASIDQLANLVNELKSNPNSSRMIVSAWNPLALDYAALPACHDSWQIVVYGGKINLIWRQRSCDLLLGFPSNLSSYATLLHLLSLESEIPAGEIIGHLGDVHLYTNQIEAAKEYLGRADFALPNIETKNFTSIFEWTHDQTKLVNYQSHERIKIPVAV